MADAEHILAPGTVFGRYVIGRRLGQGGMGAVYEATHTDLRKQVALKVLLPTAARSDEARARFLREGETASRLRHPHVVDITDVGTHDDLPYLVMEFLEGEDLYAMLVREGALPLAEVADLMIPVLDGVAAAHTAGIVHRDLKPENIFLARTRLSPRDPKILDFGISKLSELGSNRALTATNTMVGTAHYMSPEQAQNSKDVDARTDQYSLGVILYECATGAHPFARISTQDSLFKLLYAIVAGDFVPPRKLRPELPESFERAVLRAMATQRDDRFPSVHALAQALLPFATSHTRQTWERLFVTAPATEVSGQTGFSIVPDAPGAAILPALQDTALGAQNLPPASIEAPAPPDAPPSPEPTPAAVEVRRRPSTMGTSAHSVDIPPPLPQGPRRGWKLVVAASAVLSAGLVGGIAHRASTARATVQARPAGPAAPAYLPPVVPIAEPVVQAPLPQAVTADAGISHAPEATVVQTPPEAAAHGRRHRGHRDENAESPAEAPTVVPPPRSHQSHPAPTNGIPNV